MSITISGDGSITGLVSGGLPDGSVTAADIESSLDLSGKTVTLPSGTGGKVLQVVSTTYTGTVSTTSATPSDVSGFSAVITPTSATSKILVSVSVAFGFGSDAYPYVLLKRNGTSIGSGTSASGNRINTFISAPATSISTMVYRMHQFSRDHLDSPGTTSQLTYQIAFASPYSSHAGYINRQEQSVDYVYIQYPASSITVMEIAG